MTQPTLLDTRPCRICDHANADVQPAIVLGRDGIYRSLDRCKDGESCRARVESVGKRWPLAERVR